MKHQNSTMFMESAALTNFPRRGDCWAMSDWLYNHIKKTGVNCRIIQYETPLANNHRSVQIKSDGEWIDLPYGMFNFDYRFYASYSKPGMFVYKD